MDHIGMDVHKRESQICILAEGGSASRTGSDRKRNEMDVGQCGVRL